MVHMVHCSKETVFLQTNIIIIIIRCGQVELMEPLTPKAQAILAVIK